jgi:hypothetical protein
MTIKELVKEIFEEVEGSPDVGEYQRQKKFVEEKISEYIKSLLGEYEDYMESNISMEEIVGRNDLRHQIYIQAGLTPPQKVEK